MRVVVEISSGYPYFEEALESLGSGKFFDLFFFPDMGRLVKGSTLDSAAARLRALNAVRAFRRQLSQVLNFAECHGLAQVEHRERCSRRDAIRGIQVRTN